MLLEPYRCLKVLYVLLRLPGTLAFFVLVNLMRLLAPDFTLRIIKKKFDKPGTRENAEKLKSVEDIEYIISFACVKVGRFFRMKMIKAEMLVLEKISLFPGRCVEGGPGR